MQGKQINRTQRTTTIGAVSNLSAQVTAKSTGEKEPSTIGSQNSSSNNQKTQTGFWQGCLGCLGILVLLAIVLIVAVALLGNDDSDNDTVNTSSVQTEDTPALTGIDEQVSSAITTAIGKKTNTGEPRIIDLQVNDHAGTQKDGDKIVIARLYANDNLTEKMIRGGMQLEATYVFKELFEIEEIEEVTIKWEFPMEDQYGNSELSQVMKINLNKATASKINWDEFDKGNFKSVANTYWEHPSIRSN